MDPFWGLWILSIFCFNFRPLPVRIQSGAQSLYKGLEGRCQRTREGIINHSTWSTIWSLQEKSKEPNTSGHWCGASMKRKMEASAETIASGRRSLLCNCSLQGPETNYRMPSAEAAICQRNHQSGKWARLRVETSACQAPLCLPITRSEAQPSLLASAYLPPPKSHSSPPRTWLEKGILG